MTSNNIQLTDEQSRAAVLHQEKVERFCEVTGTGRSDHVGRPVQLYVTPVPESGSGATPDDIDVLWATRSPARPLDSGVDVPFPVDVEIPPTNRRAHRVYLGVRAVVVVSHGVPQHSAYSPYEIRPRGSIGKTPLILANSVGTVEMDFRGELFIALHNLSKSPFSISKGTRAVQLVHPTLTPMTLHYLNNGATGIVEAIFNNTYRGSAGYGSSGDTLDDASATALDASATTPDATALGASATTPK